MMEAEQFETALQHILKWSRDYVLAYVPEFLNTVPMYVLLDENDRPVPFTTLLFMSDIQKLLDATAQEWRKMDEQEAKETGEPINA